MKRQVDLGGVGDKLVAALSYSKWQTAAIIACQVTFPPDALARLSAVKGYSRSDPTRGEVSRGLSKLYIRGKIERRMRADGLLEYRLCKGWEVKTKSYIGRIKHDAYHKGYVIATDYVDRKKFAQITDNLVSCGVLVKEPDGIFILNPSLKNSHRSNECT